MVTRALLLVAALSSAASAQTPRLTVGIYAPTVEFGTAQARLAYVQGLARAIEQATGIKTEAQSYANVAALKKDAVDFAIIDGPCVATNLGWRALASANIGGGTARTWALFSTAGDLAALKGKKLAIIATGCNDAGFIDNAMLDSEVDPAHFVRVNKLDLTSAVAEVAAYKTAQAVFAPATAKGMTKLFDTTSVPNPAFVAINSKLPANVVDKVAGAVTSYSGGGAITAWQKPESAAYRSFAARMGKATKNGVLVPPELVRLDAKDVLAEQASLKAGATVDVRHHFVRTPGARMK